MKWGILATGTMTLEVDGKEPEVIRCPVDINGFEYEIREQAAASSWGVPAATATPRRTALP